MPGRYLGTVEPAYGITHTVASPPSAENARSRASSSPAKGRSRHRSAIVFSIAETR